MKQLSGITDDDELWRRWLTCRWVRAFERGGCSAEEFAAGVVGDWELPITPEAYLETVAGWVGGPLPGAGELISEVRAVVTAGCLSNTNALHWDRHFSQWPEIHALDPRFLSYELGAVKPDRELFDRVAARLGCSRERILFLDDNMVNVEGATEAGFQSHRAQGVDEARGCWYAWACSTADVDAAHDAALWSGGSIAGWSGPDGSGRDGSGPPVPRTSMTRP